MNKLILTLVFTLISLGIFAQSKTVPTDKALTKLMEVKKGMNAVNSITNDLAQKLTASKSANFKTEMNNFKADLISNSFKTFKETYSASEIDAIYAECTSDKIDYTDLTNGFFRKWRQLKGQFFKNAKETYLKYQ